MNINQTNTWNIQRVNRDNLNDVAKLYTEVYGREYPVDFLLKKYDTSYTEVSFVGFIAYNKQMEPISYYGIIPCFIWCDSKIVLAGQSVDAMTHTNYRNRGLFAELAKRAFETCRTEGIRIVFGFPNQNSFPELIKLKCEVAERMECFIIPVGSLPLEKLSIKFPFLKKVYERYTNLILKKYLVSDKGTYNSILAEGYDGIFRDDKYFKYKTYSDTKVIRLAGATAWIKINSGLMIGDIIGLEDNFDEVINELLKLANRLGLQQIQFHTSPHTQLHTLFTKRYHPIQSFPVIFKDIGAGMPTNKIKFTFADIDIF